jgi:hypothetical protein
VFEAETSLIDGVAMVNESKTIMSPEAEIAGLARGND